MKIERTNKAFQPIELKITIETEEEKEAITDMIEFDITIPNMVASWNREIISEFLGKIRHKLDVD